MIESPKQPFPGLRPFAFQDSDWLFGREEHILQLRRKLSKNRFVAVVGRSGDGKSSLVAAGLRSRLVAENGKDKSSVSWLHDEMRPQGDPLKGLAQLVDRLAQHKNPELVEFDIAVRLQRNLAVLTRSSDGLSTLLNEITKNSSSESILIVVDQFEEIFRFVQPNGNNDASTDQDHPRKLDDATSFVNLLLHAVRSNNTKAHIVLTMRSDYLGDCTQFTGLAEAINDSQFLVPRLTRPERKSAIVDPISKAGGEIDPRLVQRILNDAGETNDMLPVLQHILMRLWQEASSRKFPPSISIQDYNAVGNMGAALSSHANQIYGGLSKPDQRAAEFVFRALVDVDADGRKTRRTPPPNVEHLIALNEGDADSVFTVLDAYRSVNAHFLRPSESEKLELNTQIDISHEAVIRHWDLLGTWLADEAKDAKMWKGFLSQLDQGAEVLLPESLDSGVEWFESKGSIKVWSQRYSNGDWKSRFANVSGLIGRSKIWREELSKKEDIAKKIARKTQMMWIRRLSGLCLGLALMTGYTFYFWLTAVNERDRATKAETQANLFAKQLESANQALEKYFEERLAAFNLLDKEITDSSADLHGDEFTGSSADVLSDRPTLTLDPGTHTAPITKSSTDDAERFVVTGSEDKSVRVWSLIDGSLERVIRLPVGPGDVGKVLAVALSPDGQTIAAGGRTISVAGQEQIYLFGRESGAMIGRLEGLPNVANHLAFSPDGARLAVSLAGQNGIRVYEHAADGSWALAWADPDYGDGSYGVAFGPDGRIATTSRDGKLRLYAADGALLRDVETDLAGPFGLAFNPTDGRLAVGFVGAAALRMYDGETLGALPAPETSDIDDGNLAIVAWSADGKTLYAGGLYHDGIGSPVLAWGNGGTGPREVLRAGDNTLISLKPLSDGSLLAASRDPWLGRIAADSQERWQIASRQIDPRGQRHNFAVSEDGMVIEFGPNIGGETNRRRFDVAALKLLPASGDARVQPPEQGSLQIGNWVDSTAPTLNGVPLPLEAYEAARSLAIHPDGARFVLGTDWTLRAFDEDGSELWARPVPSAVWAVNISGDGRFAVAAYSDGTIRWHRIENGLELLALFPYPDGENWVIWEPEGRHASTLRARRALRWVVNRGWDEVPDVLSVGMIRDSFEPDVIRRVLPLNGTPDAVHAANAARRIEDFRKLTGGIAPGAQLHVLSIGISDYGANATQINLDWADHDAADIAAALRGQSDWPYRQGHQVTLLNEEATDVSILDQLDAIRRRMAASPDGNDIAVIAFSGHGVVVDGEYYFLPHGVDIATPNRLSRRAISGTELQAKVAALAGFGRVLLLFDTSSSGAATSAGQTLGTPRGLLQQLAQRNVTVLASSDATEVSRETPEWENGAFTEAVLEAFRDGDSDANGMLSIGELTDYVGRRLPIITNGAQSPTIEARFTGDIFASGL